MHTTIYLYVTNIYILLCCVKNKIKISYSVNRRFWDFNS